MARLPWSFQMLPKSALHVYRLSVYPSFPFFSLRLFEVLAIQL